MTTLTLKTLILASKEKCFDLSRSIDLHLESMSKAGEKAIAGKTNGLIDLDETVTWEAKHFGFRFKLKSKITEMDKPHYFIDEMLNGPFKSMKHRHTFSQFEDTTIMIDTFDFSAPLGILGWIIEKLVLKAYLTNLLMERNRMIKKVAETKKS